jgi:4-hydroxy-tetrahydrodipicolinate synthase
MAMKTLIALLGLPVGPCRQPLGKMSRKGLDAVLAIARQVQTSNPEIFQPLADFFNIDIAERLDKPVYQQGLFYESY